MLALFAAILGFLAGIGLSAVAVLLNRRRERKMPGREGSPVSTDMAWPGRPIVIVDGETAARHVGGDV